MAALTIRFCFLAIIIVVIGLAVLWRTTDSIGLFGTPTDLQSREETAKISSSGGGIDNNSTDHDPIDGASGLTKTTMAVETVHVQHTAADPIDGASGLTKTTMAVETVHLEHTAAATTKPVVLPYDKETWSRPPRIVVMSGPHKTASSTLQSFMAEIAGLTVSLGPTTAETAEAAAAIHNGTGAAWMFRVPHPNITEWVWPLGWPEDCLGEDSLAGGIRFSSRPKFYAVLASHVTGRRNEIWFKNYGQETESEKKIHRAKIDGYFKSLLRKPWEEGKKIALGAEAFDTLVMDLITNNGTKGSSGEELHVADRSSNMIDVLLGVLPWDDDDNTTTTTTAAATAPEPLRLEDIEVQINFRAPRVSHVVSVWHELANRRTLREFLTEKSGRKNVYMTNSLGLALQYVRKGLRTTLIDMNGVKEHEAAATAAAANDTDTDAVVSGLQGIVACDILRLDRDGRCDASGRLHLPGYEMPSSRNKKQDRWPRELTDAQLDEIDEILREYDCGVWGHLAPYQSEGLLRILYPSEGLFADCGDTGGGTGVAYETVMERIRSIASRPFSETGYVPSEEDRKKIRKKKEKKEKKKNQRR